MKDVTDKSRIFIYDQNFWRPAIYSSDGGEGSFLGHFRRLFRFLFTPDKKLQKSATSIRDMEKRRVSAKVAKSVSAISLKALEIGSYATPRTYYAA